MNSVFKKRKRPADVVAAGGKAGASFSATAGSDAEAVAASFPKTVHHYPSSLPFPVVMDDDFPTEAYRSRNTDAKSAIHWGQRKLLLSEIQLLCMYCRRDVSYHIVYAGSAPGTHLAFLDDMFEKRHTWELVDPGQFDRPVLGNRPNFTLRNEFFTNATAYGINARRLSEVLPGLGAVFSYLAVQSVEQEKKEIHTKLQDMVGTLDVARGTEDIPSMYEPLLSLPKGLELLCQVGMERGRPLLFVSDIRSGSVALPNFEEHVAENMRAQEAWTMILHGEYAMLKFRLPYTHKSAGFGGKGAVAETKLIRPDGTVPYLRGDMVIPIWTRPTSTEGRLVVPQGAFQRDYDVAKLENQSFFLNARMREQVHFNHLLLPDEDLDHHFDASAEVHCLLAYLRFVHPHLRDDDVPVSVLRQEVRRVSATITSHLRIKFEDAIRRRDALILKQARAGIMEDEDGDGDGDAPEGKRPRLDEAPAEKTAVERKAISDWEATTRAMISVGGKERQRVVWSANVDEAAFKEPSGFWVTTKMRQ